jgi:hypothetical protein
MTSFFETYGMPKTRKELIEEYQLQKSLLKVNPAAENIDHYLDLGFKKVCSVKRLEKLSLTEDNLLIASLNKFILNIEFIACGL